MVRAVLVYGLLVSACFGADNSIGAGCRPSYLLVPATRAATAVLVGCRDSLSSLGPERLKAASGFMDRLLLTGSELNEDALSSVNRILTGGNRMVVVNIIVSRSGEWVPVSQTAAIGILPISGKQASALVIGRREFLIALQVADKRFLADQLDLIVRKHQWEVLDPLKNQELREELAKALSQRIRGRRQFSGKAEGETNIDLFIFSGRIEEPI